MANSSPYSWTVPSADTATGQFRITATDQSGNATVVTTSNFTIDSTAPSLSALNLNGGQYLAGGASQDISWTATDTNFGTTPMLVEYSSDGGTVWNTIGGGAVANTTPLSWTVPSITSATVKVRVTATDRSGNATTVTGSNLTIDSTAPSVSLTAPVTAEFVKGSASYNVTWTASDTNFGTTPILLEYSTNSGTSWTTIGSGAVANTSPVAWSVPALNSSTVRVRATATDLAGKTSSSSTSDFTVDATVPAVALTAPTGGVYLKGAASYNVAWTATDTNFVASPILLEYSANGGTSWSTVGGGTMANSSPYAWTVPRLTWRRRSSRITATDKATNATTVTTTNYTIDSTAPSLSALNLNGGQTIAGNASQNITWTATDTNFGTTPILIEYSTDSGTNWSTVGSGAVANTTPYSWAVRLSIHRRFDYE